MTEQPSTPSIRTPLGRARGLGSARDGTRHWWMQRATAVAMIPLALFFLTQLPEITATDYSGFVDWMRRPFTAIAALLFIVSSFYHAALGLQVIIEDYIHGEGRKILLLLACKFAFLFLGCACVYAVVYINFGLYR